MDAHEVSKYIRLFGVAAFMRNLLGLVSNEGVAIFPEEFVREAAAIRGQWDSILKELGVEPKASPAVIMLSQEELVGDVVEPERVVVRARASAKERIERIIKELNIKGSTRGAELSDALQINQSTFCNTITADSGNSIIRTGYGQYAALRVSSLWQDSDTEQYGEPKVHSIEDLSESA